MDKQELRPDGRESTSEKIKLLTIEEAAQCIHATVRPSTIRAAIHSGELTAVKLGRRYYLNETEIERYISCLENANQRASTNAKTMAHGSSSTVANKSGLDLVTDFMSKQKKH